MLSGEASTLVASNAALREDADLVAEALPAFCTLCCSARTASASGLATAPDEKHPRRQARPLLASCIGTAWVVKAARKLTP